MTKKLTMVAAGLGVFVPACLFWYIVLSSIIAPKSGVEPMYIALSFVTFLIALAIWRLVGVVSSILIALIVQPVLIYSLAPTLLSFDITAVYFVDFVLFALLLGFWIPAVIGVIVIAILRRKISANR